jgi:transposase
MVVMESTSSARQTARQRAEVIMKVRCGLMTARQAAELLGVSRKTYYKWEERGLAGLLSSLADQASGRRCQPVDLEKQALEQQLEQAHRECAILQHKMALKDAQVDMKLTPGMSRAEKK